MRLSSSTSGMWKRGMVWIVRHRQTKEPDTDRPNLNHRATSRLHHFRCRRGARDAGKRDTNDTWRSSNCTVKVTLSWPSQKGSESGRRPSRDGCTRRNIRSDGFAAIDDQTKRSSFKSKSADCNHHRSGPIILLGVWRH
jgi:hypothetical protein